MLEPFQMSIFEAGGFFCAAPEVREVAGVYGKRRFSFFVVVAVSGLTGVTSIAFSFGAVLLMIFLSMFIKAP